MRFGISIPQFVPDEGFDAGPFRAYLSRAEELGFEGAWTMEQVLGHAPRLGVLETMAYAAACTERIRLGCAVFVLPLHNPIHLAKSLGTLDQLSGGRIDIGVGSGGRNRPFAAYGVDPATFVSRFVEAVRLMKVCWTEPEFDFDGRFWQVTGGSMEPKPAQLPHPPIWFGGSHPNALRRAVQHGDAFMGAGSATTAAFAEQVTVVRAQLAAAGPTSFPIAKRVYIAVDDDAGRARRRIAAGLVRVYGDFGHRLMPVAVAGTPEDCVRGVREVAEAGAEMIVLNPLDDDAAQMERLAAEVMPHV
jgi:probable F420-dependent oxidoreductase